MGERIAQAIGADHRKFDEYYEKIIATTDDAEKARWRNQLTWIVARHAISEELTLYPAMEKHLGEEGVRLAKTDKEQHQGVKEHLNVIQEMTPVNPRFQQMLDELMDLLHHHVAHEREYDMPQLEALLSQEESEELARSFQRTKLWVPTRSHPGAPASPPLENLAALLAAPIDKFRDMLREFPGESDMKGQYKLKGVSSFNELQEGKTKEVEVEGVHGAKVVLVKDYDGIVSALGANCTHYGAPLVNGVVNSDGTLTCPWHGACFNLSSGDVEDSPALDPIAKFPVFEQQGALHIRGDDETIRAGRKYLDISSGGEGDETILVIGGGSGTIGVTEELRKCNFKGPITVISRETKQPFDRTKISKALMEDLSQAAWRTPNFYKSASINFVQDEVHKVDFDKRTVFTKNGQTYDYGKLVLATGGEPKMLPMQGLKGDLRNVFCIRSLEDAQHINKALEGGTSKNVVIIGGSFIGLEVANCIINQHHNVTVVEQAGAPIEHVLGTEVGKIIQAILENSRIKFILSAEVSHAEPSSQDSDAVGSVHLGSGQSLQADIVIEGTGVKPATGFLDKSSNAPSLERDGSVAVDENFAVKGVPNVWAVGDIATFPYKGQPVRIEHWNVAQNAGRQAARAIQGRRVKPFTPIFWSALGGQLRYCGNISYSGGFDDVIIQGNKELGEDGSLPSFAAFYTKGDEVVAVATMMKDPIMAKCAELMRRGKMVSKKDLNNRQDPLAIKT